MPDPVRFVLAPQDHLWSMTRDGEAVAEFSHLDRATHEAVRLARELEESGQPARVLVQAAGDKLIEIEIGPQVTEDEARRGPAIAR